MFTLKIYNNSVKRNHYVGNFKTREAAKAKAEWFIKDGLKGCCYAINNEFINTELGL